MGGARASRRGRGRRCMRGRQGARARTRVPLHNLARFLQRTTPPHATSQVVLHERNSPGSQEALRTSGQASGQPGGEPSEVAEQASRPAGQPGNLPLPVAGRSVAQPAGHLANQIGKQAAGPSHPAIQTATPPHKASSSVGQPASRPRFASQRGKEPAIQRAKQPSSAYTDAHSCP